MSHLLLRRAWVLPALLALALALSAVRSGAGHAAEQESPPPKTAEELSSAITDVLNETDANGIGVVLVSGDEALWSAEFGFADVAANRKVSPQTIFRAGSISKSFVALAALKLQEEGKLQLDAPARELVGEAKFANPWEETDPVRLEHLIEHTAGFDDIALREFAADVPNISLRDGLAFHPPSRTSRWKPGRFFSYSNAGPPLAAYAIERIAGKSFDEYVDDAFFTPLDMPTASFLLTDDVEANLAKCYEDDGQTEIPYQHIIMRPSGALNVAPLELAHLVQMLINRGTFRGVRILTPESIDRMETAATNLGAAHGLKAGFGLGNFVKTIEGFAVRGHEGAITRYLAAYGYAPEHGYGYVCMLTGNNFEVLVRVEKLLVGYLARDWEKPKPPPGSLSAERLAEFAGYYEPCTPRMEFSRFLLRLMGLRRIGVEGAHLRLAGPGSARPKLIPAGDAGLFRTGEDPQATMAFVEDDGERFLVGGSFEIQNYRRVPAWWAWGQGAVVGVCGALMLSAPLFALAWAPRKLLGRMRNVGHLSVRVLPLAAALSVVAMLVLLTAALKHPVDRLSKPTPWSVGFWALTWVFLLTTVAGMMQSIRARRWDVRRAVRRHALLVSLANTVVLAYLVYWGVIGWRSWS